jgi:hypothetical protein
MRFFSFLILTCVLALGVRAATPVIIPEIKLSTGEVLTQVTFLSQTPTHITVKVGSTLRQIDKRLLPADLQQAYPIDADAAARRELAVAEAKRASDQKLADLAAKRAALSAGGAPAMEGLSKDGSGPPVKKVGIQITFSPDSSGSGPMITIFNPSKDPLAIPKETILARMVDDKVYPLKIACKGEQRMEDGGSVTVLGSVLNVPANGSLIFRGYFLGDYQVRKHTVVEVYLGHAGPPPK